MKKLVSIFLSLAMTISVLGAIPMTTAMAATSGTCGDNLTWTLDSEGTLTISGDGDMDLDDFSVTPWFDYREDVASVVIEDGITSIGYAAFELCRNLSNITIPDSVTSIGNWAFSDCESLSGIIISDNVTSISDTAFLGCSSLAEITVDVGNEYYTSLDDVIFSKDMATLICYPSGKHNDKYSIPGNVTSIGCYAFGGINLISVTVPNSVTSIGVQAFDHCSALSEINVDSDNDNYASLDGIVFNKDMSALICYPAGKLDSEYAIPDSVTSVGDWAFSRCTSLSGITIPNSVTGIGIGAFAVCTSLSSVTIPDSVTSVGDSAFFRCTNLSSITIPNSVTTIGDSAFYRCENLNDITIPDGVTTIGERTFFVCTSLNSITIPSSVTSIGDSAFSNCFALTDVYYDGTEQEWSSISMGSVNSYYLANATIHFNFDVTTTKTISKVSKSGTTCMVQTSVYNVDVECSIIAAGYKNKEFVTAQIKPYTQSEETFTITDDIDEVKVMVWDSTLKPISSAEVIANNSWIYE